jgi:hypothetical protein
MAFTKKRSGSETRKRGPIIGFRATEEERNHILASAQRAGLTPSSYVRSRALEKPTTRAVRRPPIETTQLSQLLGLLGAAGGAIRQMALTDTRGDATTAAELIAALAIFQDAARSIIAALGKRPRLPQDSSK